MKIEHEFSILGYREGQTKNGTKYQMLQVMDESGFLYALFGDKAKDYKDQTTGVRKKLNIEIKRYFNYKENKNETTFEII